MYDVTNQFFPQFLNFKMAEKSVAREDLPTLRTKHDTGRDFFALEALAAPSTFFKFSSSPTSSFFFLLTYLITRTRASENWHSSREIRSILLMKLLKIAPSQFAFRPNLSTPSIHRRCAGDLLNKSPYQLSVVNGD